MKRKKLIILISIVAVIAIIGIIVALGNRKEVIINTAPITDGEIEITVMATGYVQPVDQVEVGTQVSGEIVKLYVDYNSVVKKGDLLAELDRSTLQERVSQAQFAITNAESNLLYAQQNFNRTQALFDQNAATRVALEEAQNRLVAAQTSLDNARADLSTANVNLGYASIYSPIDGVVLSRDVAIGQTVASSFNTPTLFTIAEDLTKMQVEADVDEADIGMVRNGQRVTFTVDAYSDDIFEGTVTQIRLQPTVTNNVVTYTVIVEAPNPEEKLFPGMTASINIVTQSARGLVVPIEALNYRVNETIAGRLPIAADVEMSAPPANRGTNGGSNRVWVMRNEEMSPRQIVTGINDGVNAIVVSGLSQGEQVVLSAAMEKKKDVKKAVSNPLMPGRPPGRR